MSQAQSKGYRVELYYVSVNTVDQALDRIANRVEQGGHDVPEADVRRRFEHSHAHLSFVIEHSDIIRHCNLVRLYENASPDNPHREVAVLSAGSTWVEENPPTWVNAAVSSQDLLSGWWMYRIHDLLSPPVDYIDHALLCPLKPGKSPY